MISRRTISVPKEDVFPRQIYCDLRCSQSCRRRSQTCPQHTQVLPGAPKVLSGAPRYSQTCHNHSHGTAQPVIRDLSYSEGRPVYPSMVWFSPQIDTSKFTLHILADTPGDFQWVKYILLMICRQFSSHPDPDPTPWSRTIANTSCIYSTVLSVTLRLFSDISQFFYSRGPAYKNMLNSILEFSDYYKIKWINCSNFETIQSNGCVPKTILVNLDTWVILPDRDICNVYTKLYNLINYLTSTSAHLNLPILTIIQSSRYFNLQDSLDAICYQYCQMQNFFTLYVPVQLLHQHVQDKSC